MEQPSNTTNSSSVPGPSKFKLSALATGWADDLFTMDLEEKGAKVVESLEGLLGYKRFSHSDQDLSRPIFVCKVKFKSTRLSLTTRKALLVVFIPRISILKVGSEEEADQAEGTIDTLFFLHTHKITRLKHLKQQHFDIEYKTDTRQSATPALLGLSKNHGGEEAAGVTTSFVTSITLSFSDAESCSRAAAAILYAQLQIKNSMQWLQRGLPSVRANEISHVTLKEFDYQSGHSSTSLPTTRVETYISGPTAWGAEIDAPQSWHSGLCLATSQEAQLLRAPSRNAGDPPGHGQVPPTPSAAVMEPCSPRSSYIAHGPGLKVVVFDGPAAILVYISTPLGVVVAPLSPHMIAEGARNEGTTMQALALPAILKDDEVPQVSLPPSINITPVQSVLPSGLPAELAAHATNSGSSASSSVCLSEQVLNRAQLGESSAVFCAVRKHTPAAFVTSMPPMYAYAMVRASEHSHNKLQSIPDFSQNIQTILRYRVEAVKEVEHEKLDGKSKSPTNQKPESQPGSQPGSQPEQQAAVSTQTAPKPGWGVYAFGILSLLSFLLLMSKPLLGAHLLLVTLQLGYLERAKLWPVLSPHVFDLKNMLMEDGTAVRKKPKLTIEIEAKEELAIGGWCNRTVGWKVVLLGAELTSEANGELMEQLEGAQQLLGYLVPANARDLEKESDDYCLVSSPEPSWVTADIKERFLYIMKTQEKARQLAHTVNQWRVKHHVDTLLTRPYPLFDFFVSNLAHGLMQVHDGVAVLMFKAGDFGQLAAAMRHKGVHPVDFELHLAFIHEYLWKVAAPDPLPGGRLVLILDLKGLWMSSALGEGTKIIQAFAAATSNYPYRLSVAIILHAPSWFNLLWKLVSPMMSERTRRRVRVPRDAAAAKAELEDVLHEELVPVEFGGPCSRDIKEYTAMVHLREFVRSLNQLPEKQPAEAEAKIKLLGPSRRDPTSPRAEGWNSSPLPKLSCANGRMPHGCLSD